MIPGNDDSIHSIELFTEVIAQASIDGKKAFEAKNMAAESAKKAEKPVVKSKPAAPKAPAKPAAPKAEAPKAEVKAAAPKTEAKEATPAPAEKSK